MIFSVSELQALLRKAGLGAGLPQGPAEDLAAVVRRVARRDDPFWQDISLALAPPIEPATPITQGGALIFRNARAALVAPAAIDAALCGQPVRVETIDAPLVFEALVTAAEDDFGIGLIHERRARDFTLRQSHRDATRVTLPPPPRLELPGTVMQVLTQYAARTYVPATAASREAGAGAGLNDND